MTAAAFAAAIRAAGMTPPRMIEPGRLYRFPGAGKRRGDAGWAMLFADGKAGVFGDWSSNLSQVWHADRDRPMTAAERANRRRRVKAAQAAARAQRKADHAEAARRALRLWRAAKPAPASHPYLIAKGIRPRGARLHRGALVLPIQDFAGRLATLQFIAPSGRKIMLRGGAKRGRFIRIAGPLDTPSRVLICEGFATGATLAENDGAATVLAAIDCGNLTPVAVAARRRWPRAEIIIFGDDDRLTPGNPGRTAALAAAKAARAKVAFPPWPAGCPEALTDFNDLALWLHAGREAA